jgi:hypothetical protein
LAPTKTDQVAIVPENLDNADPVRNSLGRTYNQSVIT